MRFFLATAALLLAACGTDAVDLDSTPLPDDPASQPATQVPPPYEATFQPGTQVETGSGALAGVEEGDLRVFRGVPFAQPPVGALRLRDPQPVQPWQGTLDASELGPACPQRSIEMVDQLSGVGETDEDCLTLNIWADDDPTPKPVMVWIHGGAFFYGAGSQPFYDGTALAEEGVVVVTLNYRLGALGFLAHEDLGDQVGNAGAGNFGLKDQVMALEWVRENIATFGGDPDNVTVFGESAGGISTCILGTTPAADGLMHKSILQSAVGCHHLATATQPGSIGGLDTPLDYGADMAEAVGCGDASDTLACLQSVPVGDFLDLVSATQLVTDSMEARFPAPWVDGTFVPEQPSAVYASGSVDRPMIIGTTADEATMFLSTRAPLTWFGVDDEMHAFLGDADLVDGALDIYDIWRFPLPQDAYLTFATDVMFSCPSRALAEAASDGEPTFLYEFQDVQLTTAALGSHHALEIPYVFDTFGAMAMFPTPSERQLAQRMRQAWTSFAASGTPTIEGGWTPYATDGSFMVFDDAISLSLETEYRGGRCDELADLGLGGLP